MSAMKPIPLDDLAEIFPKFSLRYQALVVIGVHTGGRISEDLSLQRQDVQDAKGEVRERFRMLKLKQFSGTPKEKQPEFKPLTRREVRIQSAFDREVIKRYLDSLSASGFDRPSDWLFPVGFSGRHLQQEGAYRYFRRKLGAGYGTHWMRKTYANELLRTWERDGLDALSCVRSLQKALGHSRISTTFSYITFKEKSIDEAERNIEIANRRSNHAL